MSRIAISLLYLCMAKINKENIKIKQKQLLDKVGAFCLQELDDDYFKLCEKLILKMGRKKEVSFKRGSLDVWSAAVVHAIGSINFLFDKSHEPYLSVSQIADYFETKNSTVSNKARQIKEMFKLRHFDPEFSTEMMKEQNPFNNMVMVDGFIVPLSSIPLEMQEMVKRERALGRDVVLSTK